MRLSLLVVFVVYAYPTRELKGTAACFRSRAKVKRARRTVTLRKEPLKSTMRAQIGFLRASARVKFIPIDSR